MWISSNCGVQVLIGTGGKKSGDGDRGKEEGNGRQECRDGLMMWAR